MMQRFALSLALIAMLGFGLTGSANAADPAGTEPGATKEAPAAKHKSCKKTKSCHKGGKKVEKTETTETAK